MRSIIKLEQSIDKFPNLELGLTKAIDKGSLVVVSLNKESEKFKKIVAEHPELNESSYVVYSKEMKKYHQNEFFIFIDEEGKHIKHLTGQEISLFGIILDEYCVDCNDDEYIN